jgi:hypothetical protein
VSSVVFRLVDLLEVKQVGGVWGTWSKVQQVPGGGGAGARGHIVYLINNSVAHAVQCNCVADHLYNFIVYLLVRGETGGSCGGVGG